MYPDDYRQSIDDRIMTIWEINVQKQRAGGMTCELNILRGLHGQFSIEKGL